MKNYVPKPPRNTFKQVFLQARNQRLVVPVKSAAPGEAHYEKEKLEANPFCRILAARGKKDAVSKMTMPSMLLIKLGLTNSRTLGPVSPYNVGLKGSRVYITACETSVPTGLIKKLQNTIAGLGDLEAVQDLTLAVRQVVASDIVKAHKRYTKLLNSNPQTRNTVSAYIYDSSLKNSKNARYDRGFMTIDLAGIPSEPELPQMPSVVYYCQGSGTRLAGLLFKYKLLTDPQERT